MSGSLGWASEPQPGSPARSKYSTTTGLGAGSPVSAVALRLDELVVEVEVGKLGGRVRSHRVWYRPEGRGTGTSDRLRAIDVSDPMLPNLCWKPCPTRPRRARADRPASPFRRRRRAGRRLVLGARGLDRGVRGAQRRRQDHRDAHRAGRAGTGRGAGPVARATGRGRHPAPVRLHAGGARPLPEDAGAGTARLPRAAARTLGHRRAPAGARDDGGPRRRRARRRPGGEPVPGQSAAGTARGGARARARRAGAGRAVLGLGPGGGGRPGRRAASPDRRTTASRWCSPATSSSWSSGCATPSC